MAPIHQSQIWVHWDFVKATRRQRVNVERQSKATRETTAIIKSNGSDLMSEKGNLDFGSQIWFLRLKFWYICHRYVSGGGLATQAKVSMWVFLITGIPCSANALQYATHWHHHMRRHFVALWRCFCLFFLQIQLHSTTTFQQDLKPCYFFFGKPPCPFKLHDVQALVLLESLIIGLEIWYYSCSFLHNFSKNPFPNFLIKAVQIFTHTFLCLVWTCGIISLAKHIESLCGN